MWERIGEVHESRKAPGALDLHAVVEDLDADVVPSDAVRAMHHRVDDPLEPRVMWHHADPHETAVLPQGASRGHEVQHALPRFREQRRDGALAPDVFEELLNGHQILSPCRGIGGLGPWPRERTAGDALRRAGLPPP